MSLPLRTGSCESHVILALHEDLDVVEADGAAATVAACGLRVIVDLSDLEFIDCPGLGALLRVQRAARAACGGVLVFAPRQLVLRVLDLAGLAGMFRVYPSVVAAGGASDGRRRSAKDATRPLAASTASPGTAAPYRPVTGDGRGPEGGAGG